MNTPLRFVLLLFAAALQVAQAADRSPSAENARGFDPMIGTWQTHVKRLRNPLADSTAWVEYEGTSVVTQYVDGQANLVELDIAGPAGRIRGVSLRLYNPQTHQWSINWASAGNGTLTAPLFGEFRNGRGEFFGQDTLDDRVIFVRFIITNVKPDVWHFEQSFSADGGKTWEANWIATDTRIRQ